MSNYNLDLTALELDVLDKYLNKPVETQDLETIIGISEKIQAIQARILAVNSYAAILAKRQTHSN
jgi:hypothetical protein